MGIFIPKKIIIITKLSRRSLLYLLFTLDTCWNNGARCQLARLARTPLESRAGNWWKITTRNRTTVHYEEPLQTVVNNCNPQFTRRTK